MTTFSGYIQLTELVGMREIQIEVWNALLGSVLSEQQGQEQGYD